MESLRTALVGGQACEVCGRLPHPRRLRLTVAKLLAVFPVEFALHAVVLALHPPYLVAVASLVITTTVLVIWVVEPSAMRFLRTWLHAPRAHAAGGTDALWRIRVTLADRVGSLERVTHELAALDANILGLHVHAVEEGVRDELVVSAPDEVRSAEVATAVADAGGRDVQVWPTTALALMDGQTKALSLAARVVSDPTELPHAVAELLGAQLITDRVLLAGPLPGDGTVLKIPSPWSGMFAFGRPGEPFTPGESARAHRLAQLAELAAQTPYLR
ncbi:amino acid-binding protein [Kribbella antibiotica]|uniref:Amino acid-binding protein n=1 Tax=Kribbella antibiotica TaxID=190195 RepID=A0A4R4ZWC3_9ACTN|nr:amino acid-binding protein [Kribbella antibiotica]TDD62656.1 amino acid-binding protein [Kribbella antibiotica]